jgi:hypothetical protein
MPFDQLHRRDFITLLGGAALARPFPAAAAAGRSVSHFGPRFAMDTNYSD